MPAKKRKTNKKSLKDLQEEGTIASICPVTSKCSEDIQEETSASASASCTTVQDTPCEQVIDDNRSTSPTPPEEAVSKKKKGKNKPLQLTDEQEADLAEWVMQHQFLFDRSSGEWLNFEKKDRLWQIKAAEYQVDWKALVTFYQSMRSRVGKLTDVKSGDGAPKRSPRDKWILQIWGYMESTINRIEREPAVSLKKSKTKKKTLPPIEDTYCDISENEEDDEEEQTRKKKKSSHETTTEELLLQRSNQNEALLTRLETIIDKSQRKTPRAAWAQWMGSQMEDIHESIWEEFTDTTYDVMKSFLRRSRTLKEQEETQKSTQQANQQYLNFPSTSYPQQNNFTQEDIFSTHEELNTDFVLTETPPEFRGLLQTIKETDRALQTL